MQRKKYLYIKSIVAILVLLSMSICCFGCGEKVQTKSETSKPSETSRETRRDYNKNPPSEKYTVEEINGQHYIFIEDVEYYENVDTDWHFCSFFDSVQDFVGKITAGKPLGHSAYIDIAKHFEKDDIGVKICDPNNLYVPILPDNMAEVMFSWEGESYMYAIYGLEKQADRNADGLIGYIYYHTKEAWEKRQDIIISRS